MLTVAFDGWGRLVTHADNNLGAACPSRIERRGDINEIGRRSALLVRARRLYRRIRLVSRIVRVFAQAYERVVSDW